MRLGVFRAHFPPESLDRGPLPAKDYFVARSCLEGWSVLDFQKDEEGDLEVKFISSSGRLQQK